MSNLNTRPILSNTGAAPMMSTPGSTLAPGAAPLAAPMMGTSGSTLMPGATATTVLPNSGLNSGLGSGLNSGLDSGLVGNNKHLSKQERKALKHQNRGLKHQHGLTGTGFTGTGLTGTGAPLMGGTGLNSTVMRGPTNVVEHQPIIEREVVVERPVEVRREHHIQPIIHEREHQIQPIIRTEVTTERKDIVTERDVMMPAVVEQPRLASTGLMHQTTTDQRGLLPGSTMTGAHHATIGQKIKGTVKEVQGTLTHNPMKKEEGRLLKQGIEPATAGLGTGSALGTGSTLGNTGATRRI